MVVGMSQLRDTRSVSSVKRLTRTNLKKLFGGLAVSDLTLVPLEESVLGRSPKPILDMVSLHLPWLYDKVAQANGGIFGYAHARGVPVDRKTTEAFVARNVQ